MVQKSSENGVHVRAFWRQTMEDMGKQIAALERAWNSEQNAYIHFFSALKYECEKNYLKSWQNAWKYREIPAYKGPTPYIYNRKRPLWNDNFDRPLSSFGRKMIETCGFFANCSLFISPGLLLVQISPSLTVFSRNNVIWAWLEHFLRKSLKIGTKMALEFWKMLGLW